MPSRQQLKQLQKALISAFPSRSLLERLLYFELEKNLNEITRDSDLQEIVFKLIQTAEAQGWLEDLVRAAYKENSGNSLLQVIAPELWKGETSRTSSPNIPQELNNQQQKILLLAALPQNLRLDKQIRAVEEAINRAVKRDSFEIKIRTAVRPQDIRRAMAEERPQIVHFCGHGTEDGSLLLEDNAGNQMPVLPTGLAALFKLHSDYVKCVLLNACYSALSAQAISKHINYVIGISQSIEDRAAIVFAQGFYDGLGYDNVDNQDVIQRAFDEGIVAIQLENVLQGSIPNLWKLGISQMKMEPIEQSKAPTPPPTSLPENVQPREINDLSSALNEQETQRLQRQREQLEYENNLRRYEQELYQALKAGFPLDEFVRNELKQVQRSLGISDEDVVPIEQRLLAPKQAEYERQQEAIKREQEQVILENQKRQEQVKKRDSSTIQTQSFEFETAIIETLLSNPEPETPFNISQKQSNQVRIQSSARTIDYEYDVFISHASEDKDGFVRFLAQHLRDRNYRVWYDEFSLRMGDSLRRSIDYGIANTRYGIVVISPNFLRKEWPQRELDGLAEREVDGKKIILPIWHQLEREDVVRYSPTLADKLAVKTSLGMNYVVSQIVEVLDSSSTSPVRGDKTAPMTTRNFFERIFQFAKLNTQPRKILVVSAAVVVVFVLIAYGTTFKPVTKEQPIEPKGTLTHTITPIPLPPSNNHKFPISKVERGEVADGVHMETSVNLSENGRLTGSAHTWTNNWFQGAHAKATIIILDSNQTQISIAATTQCGVAAKFEPDSSNRTCSINGTVPPDVLEKAAYISIVQTN